MSTHSVSAGSHSDSAGHTPSSNGSFPRYASLITPFYQPYSTSVPKATHTHPSPTLRRANSGQLKDVEVASSTGPAKAPFESLRRMWGTPSQDAARMPPSPESASLTSQLSQTRAGSVDSPSPLSGENPPLSARRSGSFRGSQNVLATLVESKHELTVAKLDDFVTPSMLLHSDMESAQSSLSWNTPDAHSVDVQSYLPVRKALDLTQQLAGLHQQRRSIETRRCSFQIGGTDEEQDRSGQFGQMSPCQSLVPAALPHYKPSLSGEGGVPGRIVRRLSSSSIEGMEGTSEEMFSLQMDDNTVSHL